MATRSGQSRTRETSSFNLFHPYLELAGGGGWRVRLELGRGQRMEALAACPPHHGSVPTPPPPTPTDPAPLSPWAHLEHRAKGWAGSDTMQPPPAPHPSPEVPEALDSFPNEVPGRALPN